MKNKFTLYTLHFALCFTISCLLFLSACASPGAKKEQETPGEELAWPLPPEMPRIKYESTISEPEDIGIKGSIFKRLAEFILGKSTNSIIKPYGVTTDSTGRIIVADTAFQKIHIFDSKKGKYSQVYQIKNGELFSPIGVATDGEDNIYVSDSVLNRVYAYDKKGRFLFEISEDMVRPVGLAINKSEGILYVADIWDHNIKVYDLKGKYLRRFGERGIGDGEFNFPSNIYVDKNGFLYVADSMNFRVQVFDRDGKFISKFGKHGDGSGDFANPKGVAVDSEGNVYVVDALFDAVQIFDREGQLLLGFGKMGQNNGEFWLPAGIFIDERNKIYVADSYNGRIQVFQFLGGE